MQPEIRRPGILDLQMIEHLVLTILVVLVGIPDCLLTPVTGSQVPDQAARGHGTATKYTFTFCTVS
jgi:hypothetical protein